MVVSRVRKCHETPDRQTQPQRREHCEMALACEERPGADGLSLVNTFQAMAIDLEKRRPVFHNVLRAFPARPSAPSPCAWSIRCGAVKVPVVGLGGIATARRAGIHHGGATAIQVGTANFMDPKACEKIADGIGRMDGYHAGQNTGRNPRRGPGITHNEKEYHHEQCTEILKSCDAFLEGHFLLSSGRHSSAYCQMAFLQQYPTNAPWSWRTWPSS